MKNSDTMNAQKLFKYAMPRVHYLMDRQESGEITSQEEQQLSQIRGVLFGQIRLYGFDLGHKMLAGQKVPPEIWKEIESVLFIEFCDSLGKYDPERVTPTTYFRGPFKGAISRFLGARSGKKQYDIQNWKKVNNAIQYYENLGIPCTAEMIANRTELSTRVVKSTLEWYHRSQLCDIDEFYDIHDHDYKVPEDQYIEKEKREMWKRKLAEKLTVDEYVVFIARLNFDGPKMRSYEDTAKETGKELKVVRKLCNSVSIKLSQDKEIELYVGDKNKKNKKKPFIRKFSLDQETSEKQRKELEDFLKNHKLFNDYDNNDDK